MPMESDIEVLLSCYLADSDRSSRKRWERKAMDPAFVVVETAERAADTPTQPVARDAVGSNDYVITCNFHDDVVVPAAGPHQPTLNDTADVCRLNHEDPEQISCGGRKRPRNVTISPSRSNSLNSSSSLRAGQEVRSSRRSHGNSDMVPSMSTHFGQVSDPGEVSLLRSALVETHQGDATITGRQRVMPENDLSHVANKDVYDSSGQIYPTLDTLSWYVPKTGGLTSHSFEHPLHSLSRCCEKMSPGSALKTLVDDMAAEVTGHSEKKMYLEYLYNRRLGSRSEEGDEYGDARHEQPTPSWHRPHDVTGPDVWNTLKVKADHIFRSVSGGPVTERQQQEKPIGDENGFVCEKEVERDMHGESDAEMSRGTYLFADSCEEAGDASTQDSGISSEQVETGMMPCPKKQNGSPSGYNTKCIRRILNRRRYILDTESLSQTRPGFHPQTPYCTSYRTNQPFLQQNTTTNPPSLFQTRKAKLWHPLREDREANNASSKDTQLPDKRISPFQDDSKRCDSVHQSYELQSSGFFSEAEEASTDVTDSAAGSTLSDFRALVEAFDNEESVSEEMVIVPAHGAYQDTSTAATKPSLSLHKPLPSRQQLTYTCSLCGRDNLSRKTIRRHGARNYTCSKCNKKFCLQQLLWKHEKFKLCFQEDCVQMTNIACL